MLNRRCQFNFVNVRNAAAIFFVLVLANSVLAAPAGVDISKLPPAASRSIDFREDIQPIFERSCFRCHGLEKPKGKFSLVTREGALKGGETGVDILPGRSAESPLIHYGVRLVPDMEMPPEGKADPLTAEEIGLLRAWIDQGAAYPAKDAISAFRFSLGTAFGWVNVRGDKHQFREDQGFREDWSGGLELFELRDKLGSGGLISADGHVMRDDYAFRLRLEKNELGFVHAGFSQDRKYYDDTGGFYESFSPASYHLDRDLHLDVGRAWIDLGLTKFDPSRIVLGYELQYRNGAKSTLEWGNVGGVGGIQGTGGKNLYPASKDVDEKVHILKLDLVHESGGWLIEDNARVEFYELHTFRRNVESFPAGSAPETMVQTRESASHVQGMNTLRLEKQMNDWLFLSAGYLYSRIEGDASLDQITLDAAGIPARGTFWYSDSILLQQRTHSFALSGMITPLDAFTLSAGVQSEWIHQEGLGRVHLDEGDPYDPANFILEAPTIDSNLDKRQLTENLILRYSGLPLTSLFAEARLSQQRLSQIEHETDSAEHFDRDTDASADKRDFKVGGTVSPWQRVSLSASVRHRTIDNDYTHQTDNSAIGSAGYPAFIRSRDTDGDQLETKLIFKFTPRLKATLGYRWSRMDYETTTDRIPGVAPGGEILAARHAAQTYSLGGTWTPLARLHFNSAFSFSDVRTDAEHHGHPSLLPYQGYIYSLVTGGNFHLNDRTDFQASYYFSSADYRENRTLDAVPLGVDYVRHGVMAGVRRQINDHLSAALRYGYFFYEEPGKDRGNDYTGHGVFASFRLTWP